MTDNPLLSWWNKPFWRFLILGLGLYLIWYLSYEFLIHPWNHFDRAVIDNIISVASAILRGMGYELIPQPPAASEIRTIGIDGTPGLWIGDPCDGIELFALFTIFILAFPAPVKQKAWFIPLGLLIIHAINILRVVALTIIVSIDYSYLDFNHNYTFYILVYGTVFLLWWWFVKGASGEVAK